MMKRGLAMACMVSAAWLPAASALAAAPTPHTVTLDDYSFKIDGNRLYIWSGEFHPYRLPSPDLWRDIFQKMKAAGFNTTSVYFSWGYHSPKQGVYDFTGVRDMDRMLDIAAEVGIYVIARPGPYINAEVDSGGFPLWFTTHKIQNRTADPRYLALSDEWLTEIDRIIARHQITDGRGTVIAYQVENELYRGDVPGAPDYMEHLKTKALADGITVPFIGNHNANFITGKAKLAVDGWDYYPQGFDCSNPATWKPAPDMASKRVPGQLLFTPEFQGGAFDPWGGPGYGKCAELINDRFASVFYKQNIAAGATAQNFYMTYGGTSWGWQAIPQNYTSYDYGAAITEARQFDPKYAEDKLIGYFLYASPDLLEAVGSGSVRVDNSAILDIARRNPTTGAQYHMLRHADSTSDTKERFTVDFQVQGRMYRKVPVSLDGRQAKILLANQAVGAARLVYATSELMTQAEIGDRTVAVFYGDKGEPGEMLLRAGEGVKVKVLAGSVEQTRENGELRLRYTHDGLARVLLSGGDLARPVLLLLADKAMAGRFWRSETAAGPVLLYGAHLLRSASVASGTLALTGDVAKDGAVEVFADAARLRWNDRPVSTRSTASGSLAATLPTARPVKLPALRWTMRAEAPEIASDFDDRGWAAADKQETASITERGAGPVLFADDYGFHTGNVWYRGRFTAPAGAAPTSLSLKALSGGKAGAVSLWLNGSFVGSVQGETLERDFALPVSAVRPGENVLSVLTVNMGHEEDYNNKNENRTARGLVSAELKGGGATPIAWRLQGARGGETLADVARGPMNTGGLAGERLGWHLPGAPMAGWKPVSLPDAGRKPGVSWYRSTVVLKLPKGQDTSLGLAIADDPARHYRAAIFVNGWQMGNYVNELGPQRSFPIPNGILNPNGRNDIAVAVWTTEGDAGLGRVSLVDYGSVASPLTVKMVASPGYREIVTSAK